MKPRQTLLLSSLIACVCIGSARAATFTWTGTGADNNFTNGANWGGTWAEWNDYEFSGTPATGNVTVDADKGWGNITLSSGLTTDIVISGTGGAIKMAPANSQGWVGVTSLGGTITIASGSKDLTIDSTVDLDGELVMDVGAGRTLTANGNVQVWSGIGVTASLNKQGGGTAVLAGSNGYTGPTDITAGTLVAASSTAFGAGGFASATMTNIRDGATLALQGGISLDEHFHVWGAGVGGLGAVRSLSGNNSLITTNGSGGAGYALRSNTTVGVDADTLTISGFYQQGGTFGITKVGAGTLKFSAGSSYGGVTEITQGTLLAENSTALGTGGLSAITLTNIREGGTLALQGGVSLDEHFHAWGNGVDGLGTVRSLSGNNALTLVDGNGNGGLAIDTDITVGVDADTLTASGFYHDSGSFGITKVGNGSLVLTAKNRYTGNTTINAGSLELADDAQLRFLVSDADSNTITGTGTATFKGDFSINTSAVSGTTGGIWTLVDRASLTDESFDDSTFTVIGFDDSNNDGIWTMTDAKGDWSFSETTGELTLDIGNDYDDWATTNGVTGTETDDDDADGLSNFEEYAFGLDPTGGSSVNPITVPLSKTTGTFSYTRRKVSLAGLTYSIWTSTDLVNWVEDGTAAQAATDIPATENESVAVTLTSPPTAPKFFIQVSAN